MIFIYVPASILYYNPLLVDTQCLPARVSNVGDSLRDNIMWYTYLHIAKDSGKPFYVGKGSGNRKTCLKGRSLFWKNTAKKHGWYADIVEEFDTEEEAFLSEVAMIQFYGRRNKDSNGILVNLSDGGEGISGYRFTEEQKRNQKVVTKIGAAKRAADPIWCQQNADRVKARNMSSSYRKAQSIRMKEITSDPTWRANRSQVSKRIASDPEWREKVGASSGRKTYDGLISPEGIIYSPVVGIRKFARDHGLGVNRIRLVALGQSKIHRGWRHISHAS